MLISETSEKQQKFQATFTDSLNAKSACVACNEKVHLFLCAFFPSYK